MLQAFVPAAHGIGISAGTAISPPVPLWQHTPVTTAPPATRLSWPETTGLAGAWSRALSFIGGHPVLTSLATLGALFLTHGLDHSAICQASVFLALPGVSGGRGGPRRWSFDDLPALPADHHLRGDPVHDALMQLGPYGRLYEGLLAGRALGPERYAVIVHKVLAWNRGIRHQLKALGVDLATWDQGTPAITAVLPLEKMADQSDRLFGVWSRWFQATIGPLAALRQQQLFARLVLRLELAFTWDAAAGIGNFDRVLRTVADGPDPTIAFIRLARALQDLLARQDIALQLQPAGLASRRLRFGLWHKDPFDTSLLGHYTPEAEDPAHDVRAYLPFYLADEACRFVVASCGEGHVLSALLIAARTEREKPVLIVDQLRAIPALQQSAHEVQRHVLMEALNYIVAYAKAAGFGHPVIHAGQGLPENIGSHAPAPPFREAYKVHPRGRPYRSLLFRQARSRNLPVLSGADLAPVRDVLDYQRYRMHPRLYLYRSDLKVFDAESLTQCTAPQELDRLRTTYPVAFHLLENKPVDAAYVEGFGRALGAKYPAQRTQEDYAVTLQSLTSWRILRQRIDRFVRRHGSPV